MKKRISIGIATLCLTACLILVLASCSQTEDVPISEGSDSSAWFPDSPEISIVVGSHGSWPYDENWKTWQYFKEYTGADLKITAIPNSEMITKINLMMTSKETLPDLMHMLNKSRVEMHALSGAFVSIEDNLDKLPSFQEFMNSLPEEEMRELIAQRTSGDGKVYSFPTYGTQTVQNLRTWMYRKDIFEKHNLKVPETTEELYETAKQLKALYPESYPICLRDGMWLFEVLGSQWKNNLDLNLYYDFVSQQWRYGALEPEMRQLIEYLRKLLAEGLIPQDFLTINTKSWEELMSTDRGFISLDYVVRLDFFNIPNRNLNPDYTWAMMPPPSAGGPTGQQKMGKTNHDFTGYSVCNTGDQTRIGNAFHLIDWMYTDEGTELLSWGLEGETYEVVDGERQFILEDDASAIAKYGIGSCGLYQRMDHKAFEKNYSKEQSQEAHKVLSYIESKINPLLWVALSEEEKSLVGDMRSEIETYTCEMISKFLLGHEPMDKWDAFQEELSDMGVYELIEVYSGAYDRAMK